MSVFSPGVGYADDYWKNYFTPDQVEEIVATVSHTMFPSGGVPISVRAYLHDGPAPTILMAQGLLPYGLMVSRFHLAFFRAGFNVVNPDLPGFGLSGGTRGGPTIPQLIQVWKDTKAFTLRELGEVPIYTVATAEDSVTSYYALANDPDVKAMSLHTLLEYGDVENLYFVTNPVKRRAMMVGARIGNALKLDIPFDRETIPWDDVVAPYVEVLKKDPLVLPHFTTALGASMAKPMKPPVPFEECTTPCQMIASERSRLWPVSHNRKAYERLGCPKKEFVLLEGAPQWSMDDDYLQKYTEQVIRWFRENGAQTTAAQRQAGAPVGG
jgi:alpha-beta hydrolase superfamily lysophospholipase